MNGGCILNRVFRKNTLICLLIICLVCFVTACFGGGGKTDQGGEDSSSSKTRTEKTDGEDQTSDAADAGKSGDADQKGGADKSDDPGESEESDQKDATEEIDDILVEQLVDRAMENLSLEQKIGQLFIVCTDSLDFEAETEMTGKAAETLTTYHPGGVILFSFNLKDREQTGKFINDLQTSSDIPLFIGVDEEGGRVARIANTEGMNTTKIPPMAEIGAKGDPKEAGAAGETIARDIRTLGFNLDFAPVADVVTNQTNTEIGDRSFGTDASLVADMVSAMVKSMQKNGVCATLKHFPGQGDTDEDTHRGYVNLETSIDRLREVEFVPFESGIKAGADMVMVSHVAVKSITQSDVPASLSSLMVKDILRDELQFDGVVITDAMNMKVITKFYDPAQASIMAIEAGDDVVLMPDDFVEAYTGVMEAIEDGDLSESKIDDAVEHILAVKIKRGIIPPDSELLK